MFIGWFLCEFCTSRLSYSLWITCLFDSLSGYMLTPGCDHARTSFVSCAYEAQVPVRRKEMIDDAVRFFLSEPRYAILMDILIWR